MFKRWCLVLSNGQRTNIAFSGKLCCLSSRKWRKKWEREKNMLFSEARFSSTLLGKVFAIRLTACFIIMTIIRALVVAAAGVGYGCCCCCCCCRLWVLLMLLRSTGWIVVTWFTSRPFEKVGQSIFETPFLKQNGGWDYFSRVENVFIAQTRAKVAWGN